MATMTEEAYLGHAEGYDGFCPLCDSFTRSGDTEPDAEEYKCPGCEEFVCLGAETALVEGLVVLE